MHGDKGTLGQVWVQLFLIVVGTALFVYVDRAVVKSRARRRQAREDHPGGIQGSLNAPYD